MTARNLAQEIGLRVRRIREKRFSTASEAAEAFGVSQSNWSGIETGFRLPKADRLLKLARFLGCSMDYLMGGETAERPTILVHEAEEDGQGWSVAEEASPYGEPLPRAAVGYRVSGDAFEPFARDGQVIVCDPEAEVKDGDVVVAETEEGRLSLRRLFLREKDIVLVKVGPDQSPDIHTRRNLGQCLRVWGVRF